MWNQNPLSHRFVAILAALFGLGSILEVVEFFRPDNVLYTVTWFAAALFTWKQTLWGPILLAILSVFHFIDDILLEVLHFQDRVHQFSASHASSAMALPIPLTIALAMALESIFLGCFIYHGTSTYLRFRAERQGPSTKDHRHPKAITDALVRRWELRYGWAFFKVSYTILGYWLVGLSKEEYYITKGNIWADIGYYDWAIWNYERALRAGEDSTVRAPMGWCYGQLGMSQAALEQYRRAYERDKHPNIVIGLAFAEYAAGNVLESRALIEKLRGSAIRLDSANIQLLERIESMISGCGEEQMIRTEKDRNA